MENTNQDFFNTVQPILRNINACVLKLQHISQQEQFTDSAIKSLADSLAHYGELLSETTGLNWRTLEETFNQAKTQTGL